MTHYGISPGQIDILVNGVLDTEALQGIFRTIAADTNFHCELKQFWHLQDVDCSNISSSCLRALAYELSEDADQPSPQVAFIAESDLVYGLCRVYAAWAGSKPVDIGVFRNCDDALAWAYPPERSQAAE